MKPMLEKRFCINKKRVAGKNIEGEVIFLDKEKRELYELNKSAALIWELADGKRTVREIIEAMAAKFGIDRSAAEKDALAFISLCVAEDFMRSE